MSLRAFGALLYPGYSGPKKDNARREAGHRLRATLVRGRRTVAIRRNTRAHRRHTEERL
jgi:hypothetical protein